MRKISSVRKHHSQPITHQIVESLQKLRRPFKKGTLIQTPLSYIRFLTLHVDKRGEKEKRSWKGRTLVRRWRNRHEKPRRGSSTQQKQKASGLHCLGLCRSVEFLDNIIMKLLSTAAAVMAFDHSCAFQTLVPSSTARIGAPRSSAQPGRSSPWAVSSIRCLVRGVCPSVPQVLVECALSELCRPSCPHNCHQHRLLIAVVGVVVT